jgi:protein-L-isoaspartate(D-aspartate) O-methyltransferase
MDFETARFNMIEQQIRPWEVLDQTVLSLLGVVRREDFVPPALRALAFVDTEIPLTTGGEAAIARGECMLAPKVEARLLQELAIGKHERVLEVGTGSGYMAALLGHRAQRVISLELNRELADTARANLSKAGVFNVEVRVADGSIGAAADGPFDAIVLSGSVAQVPKTLLDQLKPGGRLVAIVGNEPMMRAELTRRGSGNDFSMSVLFDTVAPRLLKFPQPSAFTF